jgi:replicative DNA helicase
MATAQRSARAASSPDPGELLERQPPHNLEAERAVLGSLLLLPQRCDEVALILRPEDFYVDAHQRIYARMLAIHDEGRRLDPTLLVDRLADSGELEIVGGVPYLAELTTAVPTAANAEYYAQIVRDKATIRSLIVAGTEILRDAYQAAGDPRELLARAEQKVFAIHDRRAAGEVAPMEQVLHETLSRIDARAGGENVGVATGFEGLDHLTGGLHEGELIILAARPSMGKTAFALNIAEHVAVDQGLCTLVVSLEMSRLELGQRMLCSRGRIDGRKFRSNFLSASDREALIEASAALSQAPLFIDDTPSRNLTEIAATARRLRRKNDLRLVIIDYLQLIEPDNPADPRQEQVARMARRLKAMARELRIPVLCLAQLNRQAELVKDNRPRLSHLRESGAIEQDADVVMFVHREEYYLSREQRERVDDPKIQSIKGKAEIIVAKQRNGPVGEVFLHWFQDHTRFENMASEAQERYDEFESFAD